MHMHTEQFSDWANQLKQKLQSRTAEVGVIGLGYVGLPLAVEFAKAGFRVTRIDILEHKVDQLNRGVVPVQLEMEKAFSQ
jgi:UDP-N-acetyl-D-mannosaminuronate dehydrogenase